MSLLVGILCEDSVVIAADSSRPGPADAPTGGRPLRKLHLVAGDLMFASIGPVGLGQRLAATLTEIREDSRFPEWNHMTITRTISSEAIRDFHATGSDLAGFGALVAFRCATGLHLCELTVGQLQPEFKGPEPWYASMGLGRATADSLLGLAGRTLLAGGRLTPDEGVFAAVWALCHAIELQPGCVHGPPQIALLSGDSPHVAPQARLLTEVELADELGRVRRVEQHLEQMRRRLSDRGDA